MIRRVEGTLVGVGEGRAEVRCGELTYELLVPAADQVRLAGEVGETVCFHTMHFLESQAQGAAYVPRLVGFASAEARAFFEVLTTVKGLGVRRSLRALAQPYPEIARAIVARDLDTLTALPEIGRRIAETIVTQLRGKVDKFVELKPRETLGGAPTLTADAIATLTRLGEPRAVAERLIERVLREEPAPETAGDLVALALRLKED
jgi:Holliday junction DNA helicase RuvA